MMFKVVLYGNACRSLASLHEKSNSNVCTLNNAEAVLAEKSKRILFTLSLNRSFPTAIHLLNYLKIKQFLVDFNSRASSSAPAKDIYDYNSLSPVGRITLNWCANLGCS